MSGSYVFADEEEVMAEYEYRKELQDASSAIETMIPGLTFDEVLSPAAPVQGLFTWNGDKWHFRARYDSVRFTLIDDDDPTISYKFPVTTDKYGASALSGGECMVAFGVFCTMYRREVETYELEHDWDPEID